MRSTRPTVADLENGGRQPWIKECSRERPTVTDSKKMGISVLQLKELKSANSPSELKTDYLVAPLEMNAA